MRKALILGLLTSAALLAVTVTKTVTLPGNVLETIIVTVTTTLNTKIVTQSIIVGNTTFVRTITIVPMQGMTATGNLTMRHTMRHGPMMNVTKGMHGKMMNVTKTMTSTCYHCKGRKMVTEIETEHTTTPWWEWPTSTSSTWGPGMGGGMGGHGMGETEIETEHGHYGMGGMHESEHR